MECVCTCDGIEYHFVRPKFRLFFSHSKYLANKFKIKKNKINEK